MCAKEFLEKDLFMTFSSQISWLKYRKYQNINFTLLCLSNGDLNNLNHLLPTKKCQATSDRSISNSIKAWEYFYISSINKTEDFSSCVPQCLEMFDRQPHISRAAAAWGKRYASIPTSPGTYILIIMAIIITYNA